MAKERHNHDRHWKTIITDLFEDFIQFYLPALYDKIDFSYDPVSLQQELDKIILDEKMDGKVINDKLVKVRLKGGEERWILIHVEIQSSLEPKFTDRMFKYFYRIFDLYPEEKISAIVLYTGKSRPKAHDYFATGDGDGTGVFYFFNSFWVEEANNAALKASENPFALVTLAAKHLNHSQKKGQKRLNFKLELIKLMEKKDYTLFQINSLLTFIQFLLILPKNLELKFEEQFKELYEKKTSMQKSESLMRIADWIYEHSYGVSVQDVIEQKIEDVAKRMLKGGLSPKFVADTLNLSIEKILEIQAQLK